MNNSIQIKCILTSTTVIHKKDFKNSTFNISVYSYDQGC